MGHGIDFLGERKAFAMMSIAVSGVRDSELSLIQDQEERGPGLARKTNAITATKQKITGEAFCRSRAPRRNGDSGSYALS